jgi:nitrite reductase/ring-hydroxylating ferredoxin subunit
VALARDIEPAMASGTRLLGRELVVWRDSAGASAVWEDRCPHRGMRLSFGFVRGETLACLYHGWRFDAEGRCRLIPAHPDLDVPRTIQATRHASREALGMIWTFDDASDAAPAPFDHGDVPVVPVRSLAIAAPMGPVLAALRATPLGQEEPARGEASGALVVLGLGEGRMLAGAQPLSDRETCLHLVIVGAAADHAGAGQARVSVWGEALRREVEAAATEDAAATRWAEGLP